MRDWESDGTLGQSSKVESGSRPGQVGVLGLVGVDLDLDLDLELEMGED